MHRVQLASTAPPCESPTVSLRLIFLGPPGSGKGTQASRLAAHYDLAHISSGDLFRAEVAAGTPRGRELQTYTERGDLVPDELVLQMVGEPVLRAARAGGYILDGFPRTVEQAGMAFELAERAGVTAHAVLLLEAPEDVLVQRLVDRGATSHRADDREEVVRHRLVVHHENENRIADYYESRGVLHRVDAVPPQDAVADAIEKIVASLDPT